MELDTMDRAPERPALPKIVKVSAEARAIEALRSQIITGMLPAGARITEVQLSGEMGLSRATVRTALHELQKEGLLRLKPYTGWTVIQLTRQDVWELYTLRSAVERLASQLAAGAPMEQRTRIQAAFDNLADACVDASAARIAEADFCFHHAIVDAASHSRLSAQYELIAQQIRVYIRSSDALIPDPADILSQHAPILNAILSGDSAEAGRLAEEHNLVEGEKLGQSIG
ncbi:GntR family transcriptional regulator [Azorhizobium oxalatiphilum]|uniref:GntR family transcriptional regulator n=1 Tax=Azorhizobium oxalatiphilum TaxID=980631 RepID=A0A917FDX1_9HYPH|nr:GntR family transcriptional regulator [Azorhizobium oxalatiphilum]GGF68657.1 GntR family transcriptional regulator [Azorhizobium oxalatiphilum]